MDTNYIDNIERIKNTTINFKFGGSQVLYMTQIKERYYYTINFPTRKMRDQFKKQLLAYRSKCNPDMPIYMVLAELMKNTLYEKLELNSIGVPNQEFRKLVREKFGE